MTSPRIVVRGATLALTRRTSFRKAFLAPWHPLVEDCWLYALADAQRKHGVAIHHAVRVITHHHLSVTPGEANVSEFLRDFHRDVSRSLAALLTRERYDAPRDLFDGRSPHSMRLLDWQAQVRHLVYEHLNPVAAGLVERPEHMPGRVIQFGHWKSGGLLVERPPLYFRKDRPEALWLELTPPPLLLEAFDGDLQALIHHMEKRSEVGWRALRDARWGALAHARPQRRPFLGAQRLQRMHPWQEPRTLTEPGGPPVPTFRVGGRDRRSRTRAIMAALETRAFRLAHSEARREYLGGNHQVVFPHGTYGARVLYGAMVAEPDPEADVCRPGPLLAEVKEALASETLGDLGRTLRAKERRALGDELRELWRREAPAVVATEDLDFQVGRPGANRHDREEEEPGARPEPVVVHRSERLHSTERRPRRLITRRDRRRGRPPGRKSSDPPA